MLKSKLQMVKEFNNTIVKMQGVKVASCLAPERVQWFKNVVTEELGEFEEAWKKGDCVGMLDALIDAAYFILGRVQECGFTERQWDKAFETVHEANMTKHSGNKGRGSDMDAIKDESWQGPEGLIKAMLNETGYYGNLKTQDDTADFKPKHQMTEEEINATIYGVKEEKESYDSIKMREAAEAERCVNPPLDEETLKPISCDPCAINVVEHRGPSIYATVDGEQRILSIDEINLFAKMSPVFKEVTEIAIKKSQDYNNGNGTPTSRAIYFPFGLISYAQMLHTKSQRLNSLAQQDRLPNNESVRDTLLDMINYATFAVEAIDKGEI